ncbi:hypothetical protein N7520_007867 [Penicillium odoratum]|uniref:uncharacterized protein n=1 Tax=Penicillium odoratum TaxID=1167516 RepID=UPI002548CAB3|nr:uncharacterized protein N7520_007867 [Penicillium odoratum]KAJ5760711.1 hypothetical protein N7520_007867 [Penicillium odoratum]
MLQFLNYVITHGPPWSAKGLHVGLPIGTIFFLDYAQTAVGFATFLDPDVNSMIKHVLNAWADFLQSKSSAAVLDASASGWFSSPALAALTSAANIGGTTYTFDEMFVCDPSAPYHGFQSWDAFFTRTFREDIRTVAFPDDNSIIVNACESQPTALVKGVKARDSFWIKGQSYSLSDMIGQNYSNHFVGGTVYQGFLSAFSYHRWHAPVSGKIVKTYTINGTYSSAPLSTDGSPSTWADYPAYNTATSTRAVILIEADNPAIGLMTFLAVGQAEVSTCEITVKEGVYVKKGDQLGSKGNMAVRSQLGTVMP